jgi:hypothetical protein
MHGCQAGKASGACVACSARCTRALPPGPRRESGGLFCFYACMAAWQATPASTCAACSRKHDGV